MSFNDTHFDNRDEHLEDDEEEPGQFEHADLTTLAIEQLKDAHAKVQEAGHVLAKYNLPRNQMDLSRLSEAEGILLQTLLDFANPPAGDE